MANEVRATANLQISKDGFTITGNNTQTLTMSGSQYIGNIQSIGTSYEPLLYGDLSDIRYLYIYNQSTGSVHVSMNGTSASCFSVLRPDDVIMVTPSASFQAFQIKADEAGSDIQVVAVEA